MRTVKYRAFILGKMYDVKSLDFNDEDGITITTSGGFYNIGHGTKDEHGHLMQYTGLRDKNGVEIYEGDIVKIVSKMVKVDGSPTKDEDAINTYEIFYHPQRCEWFRRLLTTNKHYTIGYEESVSYCTLHYYEVIGNIHEGEKDE